MTDATERQSREPRSVGHGGTSLLELLATLVAHWRAIALSGFAGAALLVAAAFVLPRSFSSRAVFISQAPPTAAGSLAGVAARLGVAAAGTGQEIGIFGLAAIARSEAVALALVSTPFPADGADAGPRTLADRWEIAGPEDAVRFAKASKRVRKDLNVRLDMEASTVTLSARAESAQLAREMVRRALEVVDSIAIEARRRQAAAESQFLEARVAEVKSDVGTAEAALAAFAERNRQYAESPLLKLEFDRLQRSVEMRQAVYTELMRNFETARLNEVRTTPSLVPVELPTLPALADRRYLALRVVVGFGLGVLLAISVLFAARWWQYAKAVDPSGAAALANAVGTARISRP